MRDVRLAEICHSRFLSTRLWLNSESCGQNAYPSSTPGTQAGHHRSACTRISPVQRGKAPRADRGTVGELVSYHCVLPNTNADAQKQDDGRRRGGYSSCDSMSAQTAHRQELGPSTRCSGAAVGYHRQGLGHRLTPSRPSHPWETRWSADVRCDDVHLMLRSCVRLRSCPS